MDHHANDPNSGSPATDRTGKAHATCLHCATPLDAGSQGAFCCIGCKAVHAALVTAGLTQYYDLRPDAGTPVGDTSHVRTARAWLEPLAERVRGAPEAIQVALDLQGMRCAACVWLTEQLFAREPDAQHIDVNPGTGRLVLQVGPGFPLPGFVERLERFGYQAGPAQDSAARDLARTARDTLLLRAGLATLCAMNAMFFAAAIYLGLEQGPLYRLMHGLNFGCATVAVLLGAPVFVGGALQALRLRLLHLDLPIGLGIVLSYAAAAWSFFSGHDAAAYYDSLAVFIALMLWGRYLQDRLVASNRARLLADQGLSGLQVRRLDDDRVREVPADEVQQGDRLVVPVGEMLLVDATLQDPSAQFALDSIDGEAAPRAFTRGQRVPAGAVNVGQASLRLDACEALSDSAALPLLRSADRDDGPHSSHASPQSLSRFSGLYVLAVLGCAALGFGLSLWRGEPLSHAIGIATAVCVVTCPCAIGIALPLAREVVHNRLRRLGLFVRDATFLDRARRVRQLAFDKTGTLTDGHLHVVDQAPLRALDRADREALLSLVSRSNHPKSRAVERALLDGPDGLPLLVRDLQVREEPGAGLCCEFRGHHYRLGSASHATAGHASALRAGTGALCFSRDGQLLAAIDLSERARPAAAAELLALRRAGYGIAVLSGDAAAQVDAMAEHLGLPAGTAHARMRPEDKARWISEHDPEHILMLGDGINDNLALERACCSGTPAIARTSVCARADFYFTTAGLGPVAAALRAARDLHRITVRNWVFLSLYNALVVAVAILGLMKPVWAAVVMPLSSTFSIMLTVSTLQRWSRSWKSSF